MKRHRHRHRRCAEPLIARPKRAANARKIKLKTPFRGVIASRIVKLVVDGFVVSREHYLHATKGYRAMRA